MTELDLESIKKRNEPPGFHVDQDDVASLLAEVERLQRAMNVLDRRAPNAPEDDQTVELAVELSYRQDEIEQLRRKNQEARQEIERLRDIIDSARDTCSRNPLCVPREC